jgi:four helix bundle protein
MIIDEQRIEQNPVLKMSFQFSLGIISYAQQLYMSRRSIIANQLTRCGTSVGANIFEAQNAESKGDFIHKLKIAAKELDETIYWLMICRSAAGFPQMQYQLAEAQSLSRLLGKIIASSIKGKQP